MDKSGLWKDYCSFYEKRFSDQIESNRKRMERLFEKWKKTALCRALCQETPHSIKDVPVTTYGDYPMLSEFGRRMTSLRDKTPRIREELSDDYYNRISHEMGSSLNTYMSEPYYLCMMTTGTTGKSKWIAHGETYWNNFAADNVASAVIACSEEWGETRLRRGDRSLNITAPVPYMSGWGAIAWHESGFGLIPPIEVADTLGPRERYFLMLKLLQKGQDVAIGAGVGSTFYMIVKYLLDPEEFYEEYWDSMSFGLRKVLLSFKLLQCKLKGKDKRRARDLLPLKGIMVGGTEAQLYIDFFRKEFGLEPFHGYGSTEAGTVLGGVPDRKTDLLPNLRSAYLEFKDRDGEMREVNDLKRGETYELVVTPFGSIVFRYDMEDLLRVIDFGDDGMPVFAFEGRNGMMIRLSSPYIVSPTIIVQALYRAGLRSSDKWAVAKLPEPREHLHFLMEKTWPYSERQAEQIIFKSLVEADKAILQRGDTLTDYIADFGIKNPSDVVRVEYLKPGAFLRFSMIKAKMGSPLGQYKPPKIIPTEKMEIYDTLRSA